MTQSISSLIEKSLEDSKKAMDSLHSLTGKTFIESAIHKTAETFVHNKKVLIAGNGGSLCDAMHFAEELTGFFSKNRRKPLPVIPLADAANITCVANDLDFNSIFARGVEAYGQPGDLFIVLSTSGNSLNTLFALEKAKSLGLFTIALLGKTGGKMKGIADLEFIVEDIFPRSDRIQEIHMTLLHILVEGVEALLFSPSI